LSRIETFEDFQALESSEKEGLLILEASRRLMGWDVHAGSVYKLNGFDHSVLSPDAPIQDSGVALTPVASIGSVVAGSYFHDREGKTLYLRTSDSSNPNGKFISVVFRLFFSKAGRILPHDLDGGFDVHWAPLLKDTSEFGVELDNQNQLGSAIEGSGRVTLHNEQEFWSPIYDKYYFENQRAFVYSWSPVIPASQAKLIYRGRVQKKSYTPSQVTFELQDMLNALRSPVTLGFLSEYPGARIPDNLSLAFQRRLYGYVNGHRPTNVDQLLDGYLISGTVSIVNGSATLTGAGTAFLADLSPEDEITIFHPSSPQTFSIESVESDGSATLTEAFEGSDASALSLKVKPSRPRYAINREFLVAGHALCEPTTTVVSAISTSMIVVASTNGLRPGDPLVVADEVTSIIRISGNTLKLSTSLVEEPDFGDSVVRPAVTSVYLGDRLLVLDRDYTYDAAAGTLTLDPLAEFNVAPVKTVRGTIAFTSSSRSIVGTGTVFDKDLSPGDWVRASGEAEYFEVLSVEDDTHATLRTAATYTLSLAAACKRPEYYDEGASILSCDVMGKTDDGTSSGVFLQTAPEIVEDLLVSAGLEGLLSPASFTLAKTLTGKRLGLAIPKRFSDKAIPKLRDIINEINKSDFGSLVQNEDFELEFQVLSPDRPDTITRFSEADALNFSITSDSSRIVKTSRVNYAFREVDPVSADAVNSQAEATSENAQYLAGSTNEFSINTLLIDERDAEIYASRWCFLFEVASSVVSVGTKLQGARLQIGDKVEIAHEKMYERIGSTSKRKVAAVSLAKKSITDSSFELDDLSNAFSRCAVVAENDAADYADASEAERTVTGYITGDFGFNEPDASDFGINLTW
jgi:hypothetical protein